MDAKQAIREAEAKAKRQAIIDRLLSWIDRAETVDIVRENPHMERESSYATALMIPTGDLAIELKLTGIEGIDARVIDGGNCYNSSDWYAT